MIPAFSRCLTWDILISLNPKCGIHASNWQYEPHSPWPHHQVRVFWPQQATAQKKSLKATLQWLHLAKSVSEVRHLCWKSGSLLRQGASHLTSLGLNSLSSTTRSNQNTKTLHTQLLLSCQVKKSEFYCFLVTFSNWPQKQLYETCHSES